jgi:hypothetical protein
MTCADPREEREAPEERDVAELPLTSRCATPKRPNETSVGWRVTRVRPRATAGPLAAMELGGVEPGRSEATRSASAPAISTWLSARATPGGPSVDHRSGPACLWRAKTHTSGTNVPRATRE